MPSGALTVVLNSDHSRKYVFLLPEKSNTREPLKERIIREARNKFRIRKLSSVFLPGGTLLEDDDLQSAHQVWIGKGEPYAGPPKLIQNSTSRPEDIRIMATKSYIDDNAKKQLQSVATLPGVRVAIGMPDLHPGSRFPIGCAIGAEGIYPALIGSDVGCGIALYKLSAFATRARANPKKIASLLTGSLGLVQRANGS